MPGTVFDYQMTVGDISEAAIYDTDFVKMRVFAGLGLVVGGDGAEHFATYGFRAPFLGIVGVGVTGDAQEYLAGRADEHVHHV